MMERSRLSPTSEEHTSALPSRSTLFPSTSIFRSVRVWDARTGAPGPVLRGHEGSVMSVAVSPDGAHIVSGSVDKTVRVWDARTGAPGPVLRGHDGAIKIVA